MKRERGRLIGALVAAIVVLLGFLSSAAQASTSSVSDRTAQLVGSVEQVGPAYSYDSTSQLSTGTHDASIAAAATSRHSLMPTAAFGALSRSRVATAVAANSVRPTVTDARLGRALADDFRGSPNPIGDGSALDAARHTVNTGELVGGSTHLEKAVEMRDRYARVLRRGGLSTADQAVAQGRYDAYSSFVIENDLDAMMRARGLR